jgi:hypothetical protein
MKSKAIIDEKLDQHNMNPVSEALESYNGEHLYKFLKDPDVQDFLPAKLPGSDWYTGDTTYPKHASAYLNSLGIPGIKYLDQGSRHNIPNVRQVNYYNPDTKEYSTQFQVNPGWNAPNQYKHFPTREEAETYADSFGTRNFVSFRPEDVQILEKNSEPVTQSFNTGGSVQHLAEGNQPDSIPIQKNNPMVEAEAQKALTEIAKRNAQLAIHNWLKGTGSIGTPSTDIEPSGNGGPSLKNPLNR